MSPAPPMSPVIHTKDLDTWLDNTHVLHRVNVDVAAGESVALLGANGSGKTTLLRTLLGLIGFQGGCVELFGSPLAHFHDWTRVGYVPQRGRLRVGNATVREVVLLGRLAHRNFFQPVRRVDRDAVAAALEQVQLTGFESRAMSELSGGQQQRTLIARALASDAELLVMDEPFAALDLTTQAGLAELLGDLHAQGRTLLVVLHELGPMAELIERSITLIDGYTVDEDSLQVNQHSSAPQSDPAHCGGPTVNDCPALTSSRLPTTQLVTSKELPTSVDRDN